MTSTPITSAQVAAAYGLSAVVSTTLPLSWRIDEAVAGLQSLEAYHAQGWSDLGPSLRTPAVDRTLDALRALPELVSEDEARALEETVGDPRPFAAQSANLLGPLQQQSLVAHQAEEAAQTDQLLTLTRIVSGGDSYAGLPDVRSLRNTKTAYQAFPDWARRVIDQRETGVDLSFRAGCYWVRDTGLRNLFRSADVYVSVGDEKGEARLKPGISWPIAPGQTVRIGKKREPGVTVRLPEAPVLETLRSSIAVAPSLPELSRLLRAGGFAGGFEGPADQIDRFLKNGTPFDNLPMDGGLALKVQELVLKAEFNRLHNHYLPGTGGGFAAQIFRSLAIAIADAHSAKELVEAVRTSLLPGASALAAGIALFLKQPNKQSIEVISNDFGLRERVVFFSKQAAAQLQRKIEDLERRVAGLAADPEEEIGRLRAEIERLQGLGGALRETQGDVERFKEALAILRIIANTFAPETEAEPVPASAAPLQPLQKITLTGLDHVQKFLITIPPTQTQGGSQWFLLPGRSVKGRQTRNPPKSHYATLAVDDEGIYIRRVNNDRRVVIVRNGRTVFDEIGGTREYYLLKPGYEIAFIDRGGRIVAARYSDIKDRVDGFLSQPSSGVTGPSGHKPPHPPPQRSAVRANPKADPFEPIHDLEDLEIPRSVLEEVLRTHPKELRLYRQEGEYATLRALLASFELDVKQALWERVHGFYAPLFEDDVLPDQLLPEIAAEAMMDRILLNIPASSQMVRPEKQVNLIRGLSTGIRDRLGERPLIVDQDFKLVRATHIQARTEVTSRIKQNKMGEDEYGTRPNLKKKTPPPLREDDAAQPGSQAAADTQAPPPESLPNDILISDRPPSDRPFAHDSDPVTEPSGRTEADRRLAALRQDNLTIPHEEIEKVLRDHGLKTAYQVHLKTTGGVLIRDVNMLSQHLGMPSTHRILSVVSETYQIPSSRVGAEFIAVAVAMTLHQKLPHNRQLNELRRDDLMQKLSGAIRRYHKRTVTLKKPGGPVS